MVVPDARESAGYSTVRAAEALLRSLVGVADISIDRAADGRIVGIRVVPEAGASARQISRNVASALMARFRIAIDPASISITDVFADTQDRGAAPAADSARGRTGRAAGSANGGATRQNGHLAAGSIVAPNGADPNGSADPRHNGTGSAAAGEAIDTGQGEPGGTTPPGGSDGVVVLGGIRPRLEFVELRAADTRLRCRVVVVVGGERFTGIAEGDDRPGADVELAARVTIDALRSARTPREPIQLEGATTISVGGRIHAVTALGIWTGHEFESISGAEPVRRSAAEAAAQSVIRTIAARLST